MSRTFLAAVVIGVVCLAAPAGAVAAPSWTVRTVATGGPAFSRGVDVLPDGRVATLLELGASGTRTLELRVGVTRVALARGPHGFGPVEMGHDATGRLTVVWSTITTRRGTRRLFAWTQGKTQVISRGASTVNVASFAEAPDGGAVLAYYQQDRHVRVARRAPGASTFTASTDLTPDTQNANFPVAAVGPGGRTVVAFGGLVVRTERATAPFGAPQQLTDETVRAGETAVAIDDRGRTVVAFRSTQDDGAGGTRRSVRAAVWPADAPAPSPAVVLSRAPRVGAPAAVASGDQVFVAFKEAIDAAASSELRSVVLRSNGSSITALGPFRGLVLGPLAITRSGSGARVFGAGGSAVAAVRVAASGRPGALEVIAGDPNVFSVDPAEAGDRAVAVWTTRFAPTNRAWRVRIAVRTASSRQR